MQQIDLSFTSESNDKPPKWWLRKGKAARQAYIKRHPNTKWAKFLNTGLNDKKKAQPDKKKPNPTKKASAKPKAKKSRKEKINSVKGNAKKTSSKKKEVKAKAKEKAAGIKSEIDKGSNKLASKAPAYAAKIKDNVSKSTTQRIGSFFKKSFTGGEVSESEKEAVKAALTPVLKAVLGVATLGALAIGAAPLVTALANSYTDSLDGLFKKNEPMESESAELNTDDPVDLLIHDFMRWFSKIDKDALAQRIAELQVLEEDGADESETPDEGDEDDPDFTSESAVVKRVSFRVTPGQKRIANHLRTKFEVVFDKEVVGHIESDPKISGNGFQNRCWVVTLRDGFNETAYRSGHSSEEPFTVVRGADVLLRNPQRMTMPEARNWVKGALVRSFL